MTLATLAADAGADLIVFTCSSTSPAIDVARKLVPAPIVKIDDAMYADAARSDGRVGLLCTTRSTLEPSRSLLAEHARVIQGKTMRRAERYYSFTMLRGRRSRQSSPVRFAENPGRRQRARPPLDPRNRRCQMAERYAVYEEVDP